MSITIPNSFVADTVISPTEVNANFAEVGSKALNRTGDTITGNISVDALITIDGRDISADLDQAVKTTSTPTHAGLIITGTGASALDVGGGINAGTGNVGIVDTTGKIPAISSTYFASLSGANITSLAEANITDGTVFPRLAASETITGTWTMAGLILTCQALSVATGSNTNNQSLTSTTSCLRITLTGGGSNATITGLTGGTDGRIVFIQVIAAPSETDLVQLVDESASSTASNRFAMGGSSQFATKGEGWILIYDGAASRWKPMSSR